MPPPRGNLDWRAMLGMALAEAMGKFGTSFTRSKERKWESEDREKQRQAQLRQALAVQSLGMAHRAKTPEAAAAFFQQTHGADKDVAAAVNLTGQPLLEPRDMTYRHKAAPPAPSPKPSPLAAALAPAQRPAPGATESAPIPGRAEALLAYGAHGVGDMFRDPGAAGRDLPAMAGHLAKLRGWTGPDTGLPQRYLPDDYFSKGGEVYGDAPFASRPETLVATPEEAKIQRALEEGRARPPAVDPQRALEEAVWRSTGQGGGRVTPFQQVGEAQPTPGSPLTVPKAAFEEQPEAARIIASMIEERSKKEAAEARDRVEKMKDTTLKRRYLKARTAQARAGAAVDRGDVGRQHALMHRLVQEGEREAAGTVARELGLPDEVVEGLMDAATNRKFGSVWQALGKGKPNIKNMEGYDLLVRLETRLGTLERQMGKLGLKHKTKSNMEKLAGLQGDFVKVFGQVKAARADLLSRARIDSREKASRLMWGKDEKWESYEGVRAAWIAGRSGYEGDWYRNPNSGLAQALREWASQGGIQIGSKTIGFDEEDLRVIQDMYRSGEQDDANAWVRKLLEDAMKEFPGHADVEGHLQRIGAAN